MVLCEYKPKKTGNGYVIEFRRRPMTPEEEWRATRKMNAKEFYWGVLPVETRLTQENYVVLDTETTGLSWEQDAIIEIGALKVRGDRLTEKFQSFVNPRRPIPARITEITGITDKMVKDAPDALTVCDNLHRFLRNEYVIIGHNTTFDLRFLRPHFNRLGFAEYYDYVDTAALARRAFPGMENYKLETLITALNLLGHEQKHRALSDARATLNLFLKCKRKAGKTS